MNVKKVWLPRVNLYCNIDTSNVWWHGWLIDEHGKGVRRATVKQYAEALRRAEKS